MTTVDMVAGPVSSGMVSGTTAIEAPSEALTSVARISSLLVFDSAGSAFSIESELISSSMPPPTWKLASEMPKNSRICRPSSALAAITRKAVNDAIATVRRRWLGAKPCV